MRAYNLYMPSAAIITTRSRPAISPRRWSTSGGAIERDPDLRSGPSAPARRGQSLYLGMGYWACDARHDTHPEAFELATKARALDPLSAEAHASPRVVCPRGTSTTGSRRSQFASAPSS